MIAQYAELANAVAVAPPRVGTTRLVAIDGCAGSGKSTLSRRLAGACQARGESTVVLHTDDLLSGWHDVTGFWQRLHRWVLNPLRRGQIARYRRFDWPTNRFGVEWHQVATPAVLIVEGVTSAQAVARSELALSVLVTAPPEVRLARGIARDGEALRPQWVRWMREESAHFRAAAATLVDVVVDGDPGLDHDPEREYVRIGGAGGAFTAPCQE